MNLAYYMYNKAAIKISIHRSKQLLGLCAVYTKSYSTEMDFNHSPLTADEALVMFSQSSLKYHKPALEA